MANRIYIQLLGNKVIYEAPLIQDVTFEIGSQFNSLGELAPALDTFLTVAKTLDVSTGRMSKSDSDFYNAFDLPYWRKTDPLKFQTTLAFYTQEDPEKDVYDKMTYLMGLSILTANYDGTKVKDYSFPGLSIQNFKTLLNDQDKGTSTTKTPDVVKGTLAPGADEKTKNYVTQNNSKFISVWIPGIIYLDYAMIMTCSPTYSRQKTQSGFPLWGQLEVNISGLYPATSNMFETVRTYTKLPVRPLGTNTPNAGIY